MVIQIRVFYAFPLDRNWLLRHIVGPNTLYWVERSNTNSFIHYATHIDADFQLAVTGFVPVLEV